VFGIAGKDALGGAEIVFELLPIDTLGGYFLAYRGFNAF
jgi:hypothetical protein